MVTKHSLNKLSYISIVCLLLICFVSLFYRSEGNISAPQLDYWKTLVNGADVLRLNLKVFAASLFLVSASFFISILLVLSVDSKGDGERLQVLDGLSLGVSGSPIVLALICYLSVTFSISLAPILLCLALATYLLVHKRIHLTNPWLFTEIKPHQFFLTSVIFIVLLVNLLLIKLGYIAELEFPLNIDSVNHAYFINQGILAKNTSAFHIITLDFTILWLQSAC